MPVSRRVLLRGEVVLVDQPAEQVAAPEAIEIDHVGRPPVGHHRRGKRWPLPERAVWPVLVVMSEVGRKDVVEVTAAEDQEPVEAFAPNASDPALGVCPAPSAPEPAPRSPGCLRSGRPRRTRA